MKYERVYIGEVIRQVVAERGMSSLAFAKLIGKQRQNMEISIYKKASLDTGLLVLISEALNYDFFKYYRPVDQEGEDCNKNYDNEDNLKATLTIELKKEKKDQVLKLVFGENNLEILNK